MNYLLFLIMGLFLSLCLFSGCTSRQKDNKVVNNENNSLSLNVKDHQKEKSVNLMQSEGIALIKKGELDRALQVYQKIAALSYYRGRGEKMNAFSIMLGDIHDFGDIRKSVDWCHNYIQENPDQNNVSVATNLSTIYSKSNRFDDARKTLEPYFELTDNNIDFYQDYATFSLDAIEHYKLTGEAKEKNLANAWRAIETIKKKWGDTKRYYVVLGDYNIIKGDFDAASKAYGKSIEKTEKTADTDEFYVQTSHANLLRFGLGLLSGKTEKCPDYREQVFQCYENMTPDCYDRFYTDRAFLLLASEYYLGYQPVQSWELKKIMEEHDFLFKKGYTQPRQLRVLYLELYNYLVSREKNDQEKAAHSLRRLSAYFMVSQECAPYRPIHIPVVISMFEGLRGEHLLKQGNEKSAMKAFKKALEVNPANNHVKKQLEQMKQTAAKGLLSARL